MEVLALTIDEVVKAGGPCRAKIYQEIASGRLRAVKIGRSTRILLSDLLAYFATLPAIKPRDLSPQVDPQPEIAAVQPRGIVTPQVDHAARINKRHPRGRRRRAKVSGPFK
jgi:excisionase family DNA binding protein